jgi:hypothetical protein
MQAEITDCDRKFLGQKQGFILGELKCKHKMIRTYDLSGFVQHALSRADRYSQSLSHSHEGALHYTDSLAYRTEIKRILA